MGEEFNIWCNARLPEAVKAWLRTELEGNHIGFADEAAGEESLPADASIAFGQPLPKDVIASARLRWAQVASAGYTPFDRDDVRQALSEQGKILTTSSDVYAEPVAQHILAMMLGLARRLPQSLENQRATQGWPYYETRAVSFLVNRQTAVILSYGHIAQRLIELLAPFDMNIIVVRQHARGDEPVRTVAADEAETVLALADHIINILPDNAATKSYLNADRLRVLKPEALLYNVGRGATVDQQALIEALTSGRLAAAYLDVTEPEPLPAEHPLWTTPNCFITPHSAGGHVGETERLINHFLANFRRFTRGEQMLNRVI